jgi:hypothetical protein
MEDFDPDEIFSINVQQIIDNKALLPITRKLAKRISKENYLTVGDYIISIEDEDLEYLIDLIPNEDNVETLTKECTELMLITELLALAEGLPAANAKNIMERTSFFTKLLVFESIYRKGIINAYHENWTLDLDINSDIIIVEAIPGVTPTLEDLNKRIGPESDGE